MHAYGCRNKLFLCIWPCIPWCCVQELVCKGVPHQFRCLAWQYLCGAENSPYREKYSAYLKQVPAARCHTSVTLAWQDTYCLLSLYSHAGMTGYLMIAVSICRRLHARRWSGGTLRAPTLSMSSSWRRTASARRVCSMSWRYGHSFAHYHWLLSWPMADLVLIKLTLTFTFDVNEERTTPTTTRWPYSYCSMKFTLCLCIYMHDRLRTCVFRRIHYMTARWVTAKAVGSSSGCCWWTCRKRRHSLCSYIWCLSIDLESCSSLAWLNLARVCTS